jgi:hypothetical protein
VSTSRPDWFHNIDVASASHLHKISPSPSLVIVFSHDIVSWFFQTAVMLHVDKSYES